MSSGISISTSPSLFSPIFPSPTFKIQSENSLSSLTSEQEDPV